MSERVWYVAYGSNTLRARLLAYLEGTDGPYGPHRGCADPTPPADDRWVVLDRSIRFRGRSPRWGGGVAFLDIDPAPGTRTDARAWLLTPDQIVGVAAQEARVDVPRPAVLAPLSPGDVAVIGGGWYDALLRLDDVDGRPVYTVTTTQDLPERAPSPAYLATVRAGAAERG